MNKMNQKKSPAMERLERHNQRRAERLIKKEQIEKEIKSHLKAPADENYEYLCGVYRRHITKLLNDMNLLELESASNILWNMGVEAPLSSEK